MNISEQKKDCTAMAAIPPYIAHIRSIRMRSRPHVEKRLQKNVARGYVYAIEEHGSNMIFIGYGGRTNVRETLTRLQRGNPRQLHVLDTLQRANIYDANEICSFMCRALYLHKVRGNWFDISNDKMRKLFSSIDKIDHF
jgi:hypothetical protein